MIRDRVSTSGSCPASASAGIGRHRHRPASASAVVAPGLGELGAWGPGVSSGVSSGPAASCGPGQLRGEHRAWPRASGLQLARPRPWDHGPSDPGSGVGSGVSGGRPGVGSGVPGGPRGSVVSGGPRGRGPRTKKDPRGTIPGGLVIRRSRSTDQRLDRRVPLPLRPRSMVDCVRGSKIAARAVTRHGTARAGHGLPQCLASLCRA